ncbi:hypothetical protein B0H16DRAFT_1743823 [Mycena metata]|uniref:Uncharacterized protein n=1 Tax=Mycena metata TaxID=1033252 RepID=A0AAD7H600_9AGAR|nr:hypothetical protein B0H16DRAFT_1743823 [Mycena metata]
MVPPFDLSRNPSLRPMKYRSMLASSVRPYLASLLVLITYWPLSPLPYHYDLESSPTIPTDYAQLDLGHTSLLHFRSSRSLLLLASAKPGLTSSSCSPTGLTSSYCSPTGHSSSHWNLWTCHPVLDLSPSTGQSPSVHPNPLGSILLSYLVLAQSREPSLVLPKLLAPTRTFVY